MALRPFLVPMLCCCSSSLWGSGTAVQAAAAAAEWQTHLDVELFWKQGFLLIPGFAEKAEVADIRRAMDQLLTDWATVESADADTSGASAEDPLGLPRRAALSSLRAPRFSPREERPNHSFLLESATRTSFFLEPRALDAEGRLRPGLSTRQAVRKVAHGLHLVEGPVRDFVLSVKAAQLAKALGWQRPAVAQTLYRFAPPFAAGVERHQDSVTLYTEPPSCLGLWLALEDADKSNGCLRILNGSHRGHLRERLVRRGCDGKEPCVPHLVFEQLTNESAAPESDFTPMEVAGGDVLVMHGTLEHFSMRGEDPARSRESLQVHLVEGTARWPADNWLQYPEGRIFEELPPVTRGATKQSNEL